MRNTYGIYSILTTSGYRAPVRVSSVDTDVDELIQAGVHVCIAAGNNSFKIDLSGGDDYDNNFNRGFRNVYYPRKPYSTEAFMVGSLLSENATDNKAGSHRILE